MLCFSRLLKYVYAVYLISHRHSSCFTRKLFGHRSLVLLHDCSLFPCRAMLISNMCVLFSCREGSKFEYLITCIYTNCVYLHIWWLTAALCCRVAVSFFLAWTPFAYRSIYCLRCSNFPLAAVSLTLLQSLWYGFVRGLAVAVIALTVKSGKRQEFAERICIEFLLYRLQIACRFFRLSRSLPLQQTVPDVEIEEYCGTAPNALAMCIFVGACVSAFQNLTSLVLFCGAHKSTSSKNEYVCGTSNV